LGLGGLKTLAAKHNWNLSDLLAVVGLLGAPGVSLLRMELKTGDGSDVRGEEIAQKLASWWKAKTMSDAEWKTWASQIAVSWMPDQQQESKQ